MLRLDRLVPPRRERAIDITLPEITTLADAVKASAAIVQAVAAGSVTLGEAAELSRLVANVATTISTNDLAERIAKLEEAQGR